MEDLPRRYVIRESGHRIHNPFTSEKLAALGHALRMSPGTTMLDLACGSGEMLCTWARAHGFILSTCSARVCARQASCSSASRSGAATLPIRSPPKPATG
jgi:2-polyprenyl-3-methyl-5-hydroxy-6-metoxy-1,4-benzoquinol methylase